MAAAVGSSVDPDPLPSRRRLRDLLDWMKLDKDCTEDAKARIVETGVQHFLDRVKLIKGRIALERDPLPMKLLEAASCSDEEARKQKMHAVHEKLKPRFIRSFSLEYDEEECLRQQLKEKNGSDFNAMAYDIISMFPDSDWSEFARGVLKVEHPIEEMIRRYCPPSTEAKYQMAVDWEARMKAIGQDASAERFLDLAIDFLMRRGGISRIVQQNFGPINTKTFNAYTVNSKGPPVQASA